MRLRMCDTVAAKQRRQPERQVRLGCRNIFRQQKVLARIIPTIEQVLAAGELKIPLPHEEAVSVAIPNPEGLGDVGHRG